MLKSCWQRTNCRSFRNPCIGSPTARTDEQPRSFFPKSLATSWCCTILLSPRSRYLHSPLARQLVRPATAAERPDGATNTVEVALCEHAISAAAIQALEGQTADVWLATGEKLAAAKLTGFSTRRREDRISIFRLEHAGKRRKYLATKVYSLTVDGRTYKANYIPSAKAAALVDVQAERAAATRRLSKLRRKFWEEFTPEQQAAHVKKHKAFLAQVAAHFSPRLQLKLTETKYFLFLTDMPPRQIAPFLRQLDAMNERLGKAFGYPPGYNIWKGKAVVVAFSQRAQFLEFETQLMNNSDLPPSVQGLCHSDTTGRVVVGCYRGDNPSYFGAVLVHETAHGYVARYRTNARIPNWLNEGIADWIAGIAVPSTKAIVTRQKNAAKRLRVVGTFGNQFFESDRISDWQYGAASSIVNLLVAKDPVRFHLFVTGVKEGRAWKDSLRRAYNASVNDLTRLYGRSIGVPNLTP